MTGESTFRFDITIAKAGQPCGSLTHWASGDQDFDQVVERMVGDSRFVGDAEHSVSFVVEPCPPELVPEGAFIYRPLDDTPDLQMEPSL